MELAVGHAPLQATCRDGAHLRLAPFVGEPEAIILMARNNKWHAYGEGTSRGAQPR